MTPEQADEIYASMYAAGKPASEAEAWMQQYRISRDAAEKNSEGKKALEDALKYEGDTMGHCVGGYCPDVLEGRSRIYSLRDAKGEPHVTIETQPLRGSELGRYAADLPEGEDVDAMKNPPHRIAQIKGKGNGKPAAKYLPMVQDFVKSGKWTDVGDLHNTGLVPLGNGRYESHEEAKKHYAPRVKSAIHFLKTHPAFKEQHAAKAKRDSDLFDMDYEDQRKLENTYGQPIHPKSNYSASELLTYLQNPEDHVGSLQEYYPSLNGWLQKAEEGMAHHGYTPPKATGGTIRMAKGGSTSDIDEMGLALMSKGGDMTSQYPTIQEMIQHLQGAGRTPIVPAPNRWFHDPAKHPFQQKMIERVLAQTGQGREGFPSGSYINPQTGEPMDFDIMHDLGVAIDPATGRPMMSGIKSELTEIDPKYGSITKSNLVRKGLFKHEGGDDLLKTLAFLATIEKSGKGHHYGLSTQYASPAELVNTMTGQNPTLRPHSRGDIFGVGDEVGRISIQGKHHPVYEKLLVAPAGSDVQGRKLHKAEGGTIEQTEGGSMNLTTEQMRAALMRKPSTPNLNNLQSVGAQEAPDLETKAYIPQHGDPSIGGIPVGGVDQDPTQPGQQMMMQQPQQAAPQPGQQPQGGAQPPQGQPQPQQGGQSNILSMTPQGQAMAAMRPTGMATGGVARFDDGGQPKSKKPTVEEMKQAIFQKAQEGLMKPSEVLGKHEGSYLHMTEADRAKVENRLHGLRGGVGFSEIGLTDPDYAGLTWGVGKPGTSIKLLNRQRRGLSPEDKAIWTTVIGTPEMHTSNQLVFNRMWNKFQAARKAGLLSPEKEAEMLDILRSAMTKGTKKSSPKAIFEADANFDSPHHLFDTFERRRVLSDLMAGKKVGGKKGQIFNASEMIENTTDPRLLHAPTLSVGPNVFTMSGERSVRPDLNKAFPHMLHGEVDPDSFQQIPFEHAAPDFVKEIKQSKGRAPGYMDIVRRIPRQHITEDYLTGLQKIGKKKGGGVKLHADQDTMALELSRKKKAK